MTSRSALQPGQQVLGGHGDRLVERADGRRVHVLHGGQLLDGEADPDRHGQEVGPLLDPLASDHLGPDEPQRPRLGQELHGDGPDARVVAGPGDALGLAHHMLDAQRSGQRLTEGHPADHPLAGQQPPRHEHRPVVAGPAGGVGAGRLALGVGVGAGQPLDRDVGDPVGDLGAVPRGVDVGVRGMHPRVDDQAAGRAQFEAGRRGQRVVGHLVGADDDEVGLYTVRKGVLPLHPAFSW